MPYIGKGFTWRKVENKLSVGSDVEILRKNGRVKIHLMMKYRNK
jgi:hypothetical protein